jgi:hypothetical protein
MPDRINPGIKNCPRHVDRHPAAGPQMKRVKLLTFIVIAYYEGVCNRKF